MIDREFDMQGSPETETPKFESLAGQRLRGVVIERDGPLRDALCRALAAIGVHVRGIADAAALDGLVATDGELDLVVCDIHAQRQAGPMPGGVWSYSASRWILVAPNGGATQLTLAESQLIRSLVLQRGQPVSREDLLREMGRPLLDAYLRNLDVTVSRLRKKVESLCRQKLPVASVRGRGYVFDGVGDLID